MLKQGILGVVLTLASTSWAHADDTANGGQKRTWYAHDLNHQDCIVVRSPADRIRDEQDWGRDVTTNDLPGGAVEVSSSGSVWTYYRTSESCIASLPGSQNIRSEYE